MIKVFWTELNWTDGRGQRLSQRAFRKSGPVHRRGSPKTETTAETDGLVQSDGYRKASPQLPQTVTTTIIDGLDQNITQDKQILERLTDSVTVVWQSLLPLSLLFTAKQIMAGLDSSTLNSKCPHISRIQWNTHIHTHTHTRTHAHTHTHLTVT